MGRWWLLLVALLWGVAVPAAPLRVALQLEPPTLDPTAGASAAIGEVTYRTLLEGLTTLDATGDAVPLLATGWQAAPDGRSYLFHLRAGVRFANGVPFTAAAARGALLRAIRPGSPNPLADQLAVIAGVDVVDPLTLRIRLRAPDAELPALLARPGAVMLLPGAAAGAAPIGTGPFLLAEWRRGDRLRLRRNPAYWGRPARMAGVEYRFIADPAAAWAAVRTHAVDVFPDYPAPENLPALAADPTLRVTVRPSEGEVILGINERAWPLADLRVRRAIAHALDRRAIINGAMFGYGQPIGSHYPPQAPGYLDLTGRYPYDPAQARALLRAAGVPPDFPLTLALPPPAYARRSGEIVAAELRAVGLAVRIQPLEWPQWLDQVYARHAFQLTIVNHAEPADYDIYARPGYYFGYRGEAVAALVAGLRATADPARRRAILGAIQRRISDDAVNGFLFQFPHLQVADARLRDAWANTPLQALDFQTAFLPGAGAEADETRATPPATRLHWWLPLAAAGLLLLATRWLGLGPVLRRVGHAAATLLGASLLVFALSALLPGDPAQFMLGMDAGPGALAALRGELGLTGPWWLRYGHWLASLPTGGGESYAARVPVAALIGPRLLLSVPLAGLATLLAATLGLGVALAGARRPGGAADRLLAAAARLALAVPAFWLGALLLLVVAVRLRWAPANGFPGWDAGVGPALASLALPGVALGVPQAAAVARVARAALAGELDRDYVRFARAKGLAPGRILWRHALPNALPPIAAVLGLSFPFLLAGGVVVEQVFGLPGLGRLVLDAVTARDLPVLAAAAMLLAAATVGASLVADLVGRLVDPRLRRR